MGVATTNILARAVADNDPERALEGTTTGLAVAGLVGSALAAILMLKAGPLCAAFAGDASATVGPSASAYVVRRAPGLPFALMTVVAQAACLGSKQSGTALKAVLGACAVNAVLDVLFVAWLGLGVGGAALATAISQVCGLGLMLGSLHNRVLKPLAEQASVQTNGRVSKVPYKLVPGVKEALAFCAFAGPIFFTSLGKFAPYTMATMAVSRGGGATALAGHQVMLGVYFMMVMFSEPMGMTAQAFLPDAIAKEEAKAKQATQTSGGVESSPSGDMVVGLLRRMFAIAGGVSAIVAGAAYAVPSLLPGLFTTDPLVIAEMRKLMPLIFLLILPHPLTMCFEGCLLACRDIGFLTKIYFANTVAVALAMKAISSVGAATAAAAAGGGAGAASATVAGGGFAASVVARCGGPVQCAWAGLVVWNVVRFSEQALRLVRSGPRLFGVPMRRVVFGSSSGGDKARTPAT